jgi:hypothetical protein
MNGQYIDYFINEWFRNQFEAPIWVRENKTEYEYKFNMMKKLLLSTVLVFAWTLLSSYLPNREAIGDAHFYQEVCPGS